MSLPECGQKKSLIPRMYRLIIMSAMVAYIVFIQYIVAAIGLQLYCVVFIAVIAIVSVGQLRECDFARPKHVLLEMSPAFVGIVLLVMLAIFSSGSTLALLGMNSTVANEGSADFSGAVGDVWLLAANGFVVAAPTTIAWTAYAPALLAAGTAIDAYGDARNDDTVQAGGILLLFTVLIIDLTLNLSGTPVGLITDVVSILSILPPGGLTNFLMMLLNLTPDIVLIGFLAGVVEKSVAERFSPV